MHRAEKPVEVKRHTCPKCETSNATDVKACTRCGTELWCDWSPQFYGHSLTLASIGRSPSARRLGHVALASSLAFWLVSVGPKLASGYLGPNVYFGTIALAVGTYNIWAFTQGCTVSLGKVFEYLPDPDKTTSRLLCVAANAIAFVLTGVTMISRG